MEDWTWEAFSVVYDLLLWQRAFYMAYDLWDLDYRFRLSR